MFNPVKNDTSDLHTTPDDHVDATSSIKTINTNDDDNDDDLAQSSSRAPENGQTTFMSSGFLAKNIPLGVANIHNSSFPQTPHIFWKIVCDENHKTHRLNPQSRTFHLLMI